MHPPVSVPSDPAHSTIKTKVSHSTLVSRNVTISGHRTSVRLEPEMWSGLSEICRRERASLHEICTSVAMRKNENTSLTAAIRVFAMAYFRMAATEDGHIKAGHGYNNATIGISPSAAAVQQPRPGNGSGMPPSASPYMIGSKINSTRQY